MEFHLTDLMSWDGVLHLMTRENALRLLTWANILGLIGGIFYVATLAEQTMVRLRLANIASNLSFFGYGFLIGSIPTMFLYALLLPINTVRLWQMHRLIERVKRASSGATTIDWLRPFMTKRSYRKGDVLFRAGDEATEMFMAASGKYLVTEIEVELPSGRIFGELALLAADKRRTRTVECIESGDVLTISYDTVRELYFQNPEFGYYFLQLTSERLMENNDRLERMVAELKAKLQAAQPQAATI